MRVFSPRNLISMDEPNPEPTPVGAPVAAFKDRSTGLTIFGILTIMMGCVAGLIVLLVLTGFGVAAKNPNVPPPSLSAILMVIVMYGGVAMALVWLGIGSIMARRWARALILIFSWVWLIMGIYMVIFIPIVLPKVYANLPPSANGQPALPPGVITGMVIGMTLFVGFFFVVLPAVWIFFYKSPHVKATCEAHDPVTRWTDACPLPLLALSALMWLGVPMMLLMPFVGHGMLPFFGTFLSGVAGSLVYVVMAALWAWGAWRVYKLDERGWWLNLIVVVAFTVSNAVTYSRHSMLELYQRMGYLQAQIDQMQQMGIFTGNTMAWWTSLCAIPFLGYLLFVKKYLRRNV
jgi:hypothetical protein